MPWGRSGPCCAVSFGGRLKTIAVELAGNPFVPLLFWGKAIEQSAFWVHADGPPTGIVCISWVLAIVSTVTWAACYENIRWGINYVEEIAESVDDAVDNP